MCGYSVRVACLCLFYMWASKLSTVALKKDPLGRTRVRKDGQGKIQITS